MNDYRKAIQEQPTNRVFKQGQIVGYRDALRDLLKVSGSAEAISELVYEENPQALDDL